MLRIYDFIVYHCDIHRFLNIHPSKTIIQLVIEYMFRVKLFIEFVKRVRQARAISLQHCHSRVRASTNESLKEKPPKATINLGSEIVLIRQFTQ